VQGVDLNLAYYRDSSRWGRWGIESHNTFTTRFDFDQKDGLGTQNALGLLGQGFDMVPRYRSNLIVSNEPGPLRMSLVTSYLGSVSNTFDRYRRIPPYVRSTLTIGYDFGVADRFLDGLLADTEIWFSLQDVFDAGAPYV